MSANIHMVIKSPHGGKSVMDLNPEQVARLVDILDGHRDMRDIFGLWFVEKLAPHANEKAATYD